MGILSSLSHIANFLNSFLIKFFLIIDSSNVKRYINFIIILLFGIIYHYIYLIDEDSYSKKMSILDSIYFSSVVHFTLGFGYIFPVSTKARGLVIIHTILFWLINLTKVDKN